MIELQRITTKYDPKEDRIRLTGDDGRGQTLVLWLTRRLLDRLVCFIVEKLESQEKAKARPRIHLEFQQQSAARQQVAQPPVSANAHSEQWLIQEVEIVRSKGRIKLRLRTAENKDAVIGFDLIGLHQWLDILHRNYRAGTWSTDVWPDWLTESSLAAPPQTVTLH